MGSTGWGAAEGTFVDGQLLLVLVGDPTGYAYASTGLAEPWLGLGGL